MLEALRDLKIPIVTTNYDGLIEEVTKLPAVTWKEKHKIERIAHGQEEAVLHLHGHGDQPESSILGIRDYEDIRTDDHAQAAINALRLTKSLLFVGCGEGLNDPNFGPFSSGWRR